MFVSPIHLIPAKTKSQIRACLDIRSKVFIKEQGVGKDLEIDEHDIKSDVDYFLFVCNGENAGCCRVLVKDENTIILQRFAVLRGYRKQGVGRTSLMELEKFYFQKGFSKIELDAQIQAVRFYEKCGYGVCSEEFLEAGICHKKMMKSIKDKI